MAKSSNSKSKPHFFLSCFGFSDKLRRFKPPKSPAGHRKRPFSWFRNSKPPTPVHSSFPSHTNPSVTNSDRLSSVSIAPTATSKSSNEDLAVAVPVATKRTGQEVIIGPHEVKNDIVAEKTIHESCEHSNLPNKFIDQSQSRFSLTKKLESFRLVRFTQTASPKKNPKSTNLQRPTISHSLSFPPPKPAPLNKVSEPSRSKQFGSMSANRKSSQRYRSAVAMSVLMMTLAMMVLWGRICAILCTATWIFVVTSLRSIVEEYDRIDFVESDSYSEGFKKKLVVLKGFMCRNHK
uniref:Uncharacterized protein n=1 Tax=Cucumis melo TaxID=3656 RepID=A0A9I9DU52_CUCME